MAANSILAVRTFTWAQTRGPGRKS